MVSYRHLYPDVSIPEVKWTPDVTWLTNSSAKPGFYENYVLAKYDLMMFFVGPAFKFGRETQLAFKRAYETICCKCECGMCAQMAGKCAWVCRLPQSATMWLPERSEKNAAGAGKEGGEALVTSPGPKVGTTLDLTSTNEVTPTKG